MTTYRLIAEEETDAEAPITADLMKALQKNLLAVIEGDVTAPKIANAALNLIQTAALNDGAVTRQKLNTATASLSYSFGGGGGSTNISMNPYSFFPCRSGGATAGVGTGTGADTPAVALSSASSASGSVFWRYINP